MKRVFLVVAECLAWGALGTVALLAGGFIAAWLAWA